MAATRVTRSDSKARTKADLSVAARSVFLRRGFHAATLDEIAEEAGYTKGAVYSNFEGKDDLFLALLAEHYVQRARLYAGLPLHQSDAEQTYRAIARVMLEAYAREPAWWPLISEFATHASNDPDLRERLRLTREGFLDALATSVLAASEHHDLTFVLPPREVARGVGALMRGMTTEWLVDPASAASDDFEEMVAAFLRGLAAPMNERSRR
jgi:AcrR family transcriptional regulator